MARGRRGGPAHPRQRPRLRRHLRGLVLPALRRLQDRVRARGRQPLPDPQDRARDREGGQLVLPAVHASRSRSSASTPSTPSSSRRATATTRRSRSSRAACATCRSAARGSSGACRCRGTSRRSIYVWIDALLNYYTALSYAREGEDLTERFWPADVHLIGKDILKFHAVIWPAMLMAADIEVPRRVGIHGFLLLGEHKMSKSLGNVIEPFQVADMYGADALRFYLLREVSFGSDGEVSPEGFETRYTTELANEYGNLASRTLAMIAPLPRRRRARRRAGRRRSRSEFEGLREAVVRAPRGDRADRRPRRDLAARQAAQPLRPGGGALAAVQGRVRGASSSTRSSTRWPRACAWSRCCCTRSCPRSAERLLAALGQRGPVAGRRPPGRGRRRRDARRARAALPAGRAARAARRPDVRRPVERATAVIDTHCHLDHCEPPTGELVERARAAGLTRIATVGHDGRLDRARARGGAEHDEVFAIVGRHPHETAGFAAADARGDRARRGRPERPRDRRDRPRLLPRLRAPRRPAPRLRGAARACAAAWGCRSRSTPAPPRTTRSRSCASTPTACRR